MTTTAEYQQNFLNTRREYWMTMLDQPYPTRRGESCGGRHGGGWDWWIWKGADYRSERAHCGYCDGIVRGEISPWNDRALQDWYASPYMQAQRIVWRNRRRHTAIKFIRKTWITRDI